MWICTYITIKGTLSKLQEAVSLIGRKYLNNQMRQIDLYRYSCQYYNFMEKVYLLLVFFFFLLQCCKQDYRLTPDFLIKLRIATKCIFHALRATCNFEEDYSTSLSFLNTLPYFSLIYWNFLRKTSRRRNFIPPYRWDVQNFPEEKRNKNDSTEKSAQKRTFSCILFSPLCFQLVIFSVIFL